MEAQTINCPMCGAATTSDHPQCRYCGAKLATVACPTCFAMMFIGSKHCARCGAGMARQEVAAAGQKCPRCTIELHVVAIGESRVLECEKCFGLWLNTAIFETICADREQQSRVLQSAELTEGRFDSDEIAIRYVPCPECSQLMNRANFARCSGVIIDLCRNHGIWFDRDELSRIIEFIQSGGLERSREKEKTALEEERRRLQQERLTADIHQPTSFEWDQNPETRLSTVALRSLLDFLLH
jgi:Zn-finger nucleic acid-binding protein